MSVQGSTSSITKITFSNSGDLFLLNSADNTLRLFSAHVRDGRPLLVYKDLINRVKFTDCCFSHDGEHGERVNARECSGFLGSYHFTLGVANTPLPPRVSLYRSFLFSSCRIVHDHFNDRGVGVGVRSSQYHGRSGQQARDAPRLQCNIRWHKLNVSVGKQGRRMRLVLLVPTSAPYCSHRRRCRRRNERVQFQCAESH